TIAAILEELVHQVGILVPQEDPHLDARRGFRQLDHERERGDRRAAPVLRDHVNPPRGAAALKRREVSGRDDDGVEGRQHALLVHGHLIEILAHRQPLGEALFGHHPSSSSSILPAMASARAATSADPRLPTGCGITATGYPGMPARRAIASAVATNGSVMTTAAGSPRLLHEMASSTLPDEQEPQSPTAVTTTAQRLASTSASSSATGALALVLATRTTSAMPWRSRR